MINLVITQDGKVTGDNGKIIAYEGQDYSEIINIVHPQYVGCRYYVEYKYNNTIYKNQLNDNGQVSLKVENSGYLKCQLLAITIDGEIKFKSYPWNLIIKESLRTEAEHYPCSSINHHHEHSNRSCGCNCDKSNNNFNAYEAYSKLKMELENESDIRFNEMQLLIKDISEIKKYLHLDDTEASHIDANTKIFEGIWYADSTSNNFPDSTHTKSYKLVVSKYGTEYILQHAYENNSNDVYYRSSKDGVSWSEWTKLNLSTD
ncbi:MAG: pyocin knob domain-containing protein [Candidatus Onthovivens sp.]|nr:pyocin knob domain-containing protein [Candidatus Onthovivens sp.]